MRLICASSEDLIRSSIPERTIQLFKPWNRLGGQRASAGSVFLGQLKKSGLSPSSRQWDLIAICLAVIAADNSTLRKPTADGWTRTFELDVEVNDPSFWELPIKTLEKALMFLTTDRWSINLVAGSFATKPPKVVKIFPEEKVILLSGGLDSLVGAYESRGLIAVSQNVPNDTDVQNQFALKTGVTNHLRFNPAVRCRKKEDTQRSRSVFFILAALLAATHTERYQTGETVQILIPENGFIALNPPMSDIRIGALSTRTVHPYFLKKFENFLQISGFQVEIINPYWAKTKGEMLVPHAKDAEFLKLAYMSTSCSGFPRHKRQHCGRCVPCQIRRAAFIRADIDDRTKFDWPPAHQPGYLSENLTPNKLVKSRIWDDVRAVQLAVAEYEESGINALQKSILQYPGVEGRDVLEEVIERGLAELSVLHSSFGKG